jgi:hypothetical protein
MKTLLTLFAAALISLTPAIAHSQTVTNIGPGNVVASAYGSCSNCTFNITPGYTFTIDATETYTNVTFNGGTVIFSTAVNTNSTITLTNDTTLINITQGIKGMNFNNDSISITQPLTYSTGVAEIANSRISVGNTTKFQNANLIADSIHVNAALSYSGSNDSVSNSHITLENGSSWSFQSPTISNSVFDQMANSQMTSNALSATNSSFYEDASTPGTATLFKISGAGTFNNSNVGLTNGAGFTVTSTTTWSGGSITASGSSVVTAKGAWTVSNASMNFSGSSQFNPSSAMSFTGSSLALSGSASMGASSSIDFESSAIKLSGSATMSTGSTITVGTNSDLTVGDGSGAASVSASTIDVTGSSLLGVAPSASITVSSGKLTGNSGATYTVAGKTLSGCATFDGTKNYQTCVTLAIGNMVLTATVKSPGEVVLSWTDAATTPVNEYLVQRSTGNDSWSPIGTVDATTSTTGDYSFVDADAPAGEVFYRIERVAANGALGYSPVSTITITTAAVANTHTGIFPNPAIGGRFYLTTPGTGETIVNVFTTTGQLLLHTSLQGQTQYPVQLPSQPLSLSAIVVQIVYENNTRSFTVLEK